MFNKTQNLQTQKLKEQVFKTILLSFVLCFFPIVAQAQCAMCRAALQGEEAQAQAEGINNGIVFLMVIPYILIAVAGYAVYKIKYSKKNDTLKRNYE